eukprot:365977-Chlamydomonas_euryale.AAC.2
MPTVGREGRCACPAASSDAAHVWSVGGDGGGGGGGGGDVGVGVGVGHGEGVFVVVMAVVVAAGDTCVRPYLFKAALPQLPHVVSARPHWVDSDHCMTRLKHPSAVAAAAGRRIAEGTA